MHTRLEYWFKRLYSIPEGAGEWAKRGERWIRVKRGEEKKMRRDIKQELRGQDKEDEEVEIHRTSKGDRHCNREKEKKKKTPRKMKEHPAHL